MPRPGELADATADPAIHAGMTYMPSLDGIRALAIIAVLVFHAAPAALPGGFVGVDVFFVLSGFLITSVILVDVERRKFSMREFYLRRVQRLLPNVIATVIGTLILTAFLLPGSFLGKAASEGAWVLCNLSNVYMWRHVGGYWGDAATSIPLLHTWSLAVEEQFYLLYPPLLVLVPRGKRVLAVVGAVGLSFAAAALYGRGHAVAAFYLLPTRAWEPLLGAAFAVARRRNVDSRIGWLGLAVVLLSFAFATEARYAVVGVPIIPALGALALIAGATSGTSGLERALSVRPLVEIGKVSYSLYLWHWPLIVIVKAWAELTGRSEQWGRLVGVSAGIVLGIIAYVVVEQPLRTRGKGRARRLGIVGIGFAGALVASVVLSRRPVVFDPLHLFDPTVFEGGSYTAGGPPHEDRAAGGIRVADVKFPPSPERALDAWRTGGIVHDWGHGTPRVVVLGSSHAIMYGAVIDDICRRLGLSVAFLSVDGTSPFFPATTKYTGAFPVPTLLPEFDEARRRFLALWHPDVVLVIDRWDERDPKTLASRLEDLAAKLSVDAKHSVFFGQIPALRYGATINLREYATWRMRKEGRLPTLTEDASLPLRTAANQDLDELARRVPTMQAYHPETTFHRPDGSVRWVDGRSVLYIDDNHLSQAGAILLRAQIEDVIRRATIPETAPKP